MDDVREFLRREIPSAFLEDLREVTGLPLAVEPGATLFDVLRQSAIERAETSHEWAEFCARWGFTDDGTV